ncbi:MAG: dihydrofolate reductase [Bacteroidales bacterium]
MSGLSLIVAIAEDGAIGAKGDLLCYLPADLKHFKEITMGGAIIMGRKTFDSLPKGALPGRKNVVITRNAEFTADNIVVAHSVEQAMAMTDNDNTERYIIGGAEIYRAALPLVSTIYLTRIHAEFPEADTHFPEIDMQQWSVKDEIRYEADEKNKIAYSFITLHRK